MNSFTHFDERGNAIMVDVSGKPETVRIATATGMISMNQECYDAVVNNQVAKGDVLSVARIAAIMGTKQTSSLIPLCHPLPLKKVSVEFELLPDQYAIRTYVTAKTEGQTGVEMEALTGVSVCLLTIYDMCKAIDKRMCMSDIHLCEKSGGKSGNFKY